MMILLNSLWKKIAEIHNKFSYFLLFLWKEYSERNFNCKMRCDADAADCVMPSECRSSLATILLVVDV